MEDAQHRVGVFVDAENLTSWLKRGGLEDLLVELAALGPIVVRRAYGKWTARALQGLQAEVNRMGFELVHTYHPVSGKNSTDIQMVVDVMEYSARVPELQWIALATGDSDFSPLFRRLRELGRDVIGVGPRSALSETVKTSCSRFVYTDRSAEPALLDTEASAQQRARAADERRAEFEDAEELLDRALATFEAPAHLSRVKERMLSMDSAFDERRLGYRSFLKFVGDCSGVDLKFAEERDAWYAGLSREAAAGNETAAVSEQAEPLGKRYIRQLKKTGWKRLPADKQLRIYHAIAGINKPLTKEALIDRALGSVKGSVTATEVRKAIAIFQKADLIEAVDGAGSEVLLRLRSGESDRAVLDAVDRAKCLRLLGTLDPELLPLKPDALLDVLSGEPDLARSERLIREAEMRAGSEEHRADGKRSPA